MKQTIDLPYVVPPLTLNQRYHWRRKAHLTKEIRAYVARKAQHIGPVEFVIVQLHYVPKDRRRRDPDNLVPTLKPAIDGLVDAGLVPDDTPQWVAWIPPHIHTPDQLGPRMWLELTTGETTP